MFERKFRNDRSLTKNMIDRLRRRFKSMGGYEISITDELNIEEWEKRGKPCVWRRIVGYEKMVLVEEVKSGDIILFEDDKIVGKSVYTIMYGNYVAVSKKCGFNLPRLYKEV